MKRDRDSRTDRAYFFFLVFLSYTHHLRTKRAWPPAQGCGDDRNVLAAAAAKPRVGNVTCRVRARGKQRGVEGGATKISNGEKRTTKVFRGFYLFYFFFFARIFNCPKSTRIVVYSRARGWQ